MGLWWFRDADGTVPCVFTVAISGFLHIHDEHVLAEELIKLKNVQLCDTCTRQH
jgi:hypothetical protein